MGIGMDLYGKTKDDSEFPVGNKPEPFDSPGRENLYYIYN